MNEDVIGGRAAVTCLSLEVESRPSPMLTQIASTTAFQILSLSVARGPIIFWKASGDLVVQVGPPLYSKSLVLQGVKLSVIAESYSQKDQKKHAPSNHLSTFCEWIFDRLLLSKALYLGQDTFKQAFARMIPTASDNATNDSRGGFDEASIDEALELFSTLHEHTVDSSLWTEITAHSAFLRATMGSITLHVFLSVDRLIGLGEPLRSGDEIWMLFGGIALYVLRRCTTSREHFHHHFIGECYVHGFTGGQGMDLWRSGALKDE